jgi:phospholipid N-methyltransferase
VSAVARSGRLPGTRATALIPETTEPYFVVEAGAGTGATSDAIQARLPYNGTLVTVEPHPPTVDHLRATRPWLDVIAGDPADLPHLLRRFGLTRPDLIISALPWAQWSAERQASTLNGLADALTPDGVLATTVAHCAPSTPAQLRQRFRSVREERLAWLNVQPARWYVASTPLLPA